MTSTASTTGSCTRPRPATTSPPAWVHQGSPAPAAPPGSPTTYASRPGRRAARSSPASARPPERRPVASRSRSRGRVSKRAGSRPWRRSRSAPPSSRRLTSQCTARPRSRQPCRRPRVRVRRTPRRRRTGPAAPTRALFQRRVRRRPRRENHGALPSAMAHYCPIGAQTPARLSPAGAALPFFGSVAPVDLGLQHVGRLEHHHPARKDRHLDSCLGVAPNALALGAHHERAEAGQLDGFATRSCIADFIQNRLHQLRQLRARQSNLVIDNFRQIGASHGLSGFAVKPSVRHIEPQSNFPPPRGVLGRADPQGALAPSPYLHRTSFWFRQSLRVEPIIGANENPRFHIAACPASASATRPSGTLLLPPSCPIGEPSK